MEKQKQSWIWRIALLAQRVSDGARKNIERIKRFHRACDDVIARRSPLDQERIDAAQTVDQLLDQLDAEQECINKIVEMQSQLVGGVPIYERRKAIIRLIKLRIEGLDLRGARWSIFMRFYHPGKVDQFGLKCLQEPAQCFRHRQMYMENATGRVMFEGEYQALGGPGRSAEFTRIR